MKSLFVYFFVLFFLVSCGPSQRLIDLENRVNENQSRIEILYNREVYNPVITDSYITLTKMSTVMVKAKIGENTQTTAGVAVQVKEHVEGQERDIVYVWTVAHAITRGNLSINEEKEIEYSFSEAKSATVSFKWDTAPVSGRKAEIIIYDLGLDLALLRVDVTNSGVSIPDIKFADERRRTGSALVVVGHPGPRSWAITEGLVSSYDLRLTYLDREGKIKFGERIMETTIDVSFGYSGGPVFDPMTGKIYGYTTRMTPDTKDALVIPIEYLIQFAIDNDLEYALPN